MGPAAEDNRRRLLPQVDRKQLAQSRPGQHKAVSRVGDQEAIGPGLFGRREQWPQVGGPVGSVGCIDEPDVHSANRQNAIRQVCKPEGSRIDHRRNNAPAGGDVNPSGD